MQDQYDTEQTTWVEREKEIIQTLDDNVYELKKMVDKEKTQRNLDVGAIRDKQLDTLK